MAASLALFYALCNASDPQQAGWVAGSGTVTQRGLCVTYDASAGSSAPLTLQPCSGNASQVWSLTGGAFSSPSGLVAWNGQQTPGVSATPALGPGCQVAGSPLPGGLWNGLFDVNSPSPGMIQGRFATSGGPSPSGLCVSAATPPLAVPTADALAVPTADVLAWSRKEVMCLYDFDMCTFTPSMLQGCDCGRPPPPVDTWAPSALDTDSWVAAGVSAGCQIHILVAKHLCGFVSWNSTAGKELGYNYSSLYSSTPVDVVAPFVASVRKAGMAVGMYYSLTNNARTNTCGGNIQPNPAPGQIAVTPAQYDGLVKEHLTELWSNYGAASEARCLRWRDGACGHCA